MQESLKQIPSFAIYAELTGMNVEHEIANAEKSKRINQKFLMDIAREGNPMLVKLKSFDGEDLALKLSKNRFSRPNR